DPSDYDWNPGTDYKPIADNPVVINFPQPVPILDWFAEPDEVTDNSGTARRPAIKLSWDASADTLVDVRGIKFEVRLASTLVTIHEGRT
ncbi:hypothetical protein ACU6QF_00185, partial [Aeromonas veronii]|uniref:hypothetical protein n=1 Tax=Aeromonas veronii TaxID=654 RepID=UPI00406D0354